MLSRLFLISPLWAAYFFHETHDGPLREEMSFSTLLIVSVVAYLILCFWDFGRAPRSAISVIIRNMVLSHFAVWSFLLLFGVGMFFWYMMSHAAVWVLLFWQMVGHTFAHHLIYPLVQSDYRAVRKTGWHPLWDVTVFNFDSDLIKNGGFEEPVYTDFVPPEYWRFQCPVCGARQGSDFGVCWYPGCNYGADGDDTAYFERWGS
jgi:hypothetical protein